MIKIILILFLFLTGCSQNQQIIEINNHKINIEVADTDEKRIQGLSGRKNLCGDCGLLFVFEKPGNYSFWMKDMNFPLDFIFINGEQIIGLKENIFPSTYPHTFTATTNFDKALEVNSGFVTKNGIKLNQRINKLSF